MEPNENAQKEYVSSAPAKFLKPYQPQEVEPAIYKKWEESGYFNPDNLPDAAARTTPYTIIMPPPNVTGVLHMGHALMLTTEDILIRYKRMRGYKALWLPGTDHAAIATQSKVEKELSKKEGRNRHDLGREAFLERVRAFAQDSHDTIVRQVKTMGASCDWSREAYTLDAARNRAVNTMFKRMYDDGLIYRGNRIVNWDPKGQTTISDDEIVYEERTAILSTFKYSHDFPVAVSTTRLETKVGDTAVAVHPADERYRQFIGKEYDVTFCGIPLHIRIIADESVDPAFGTGALGVTPAHSQIDWEIADRHNLPRPQVINEHARMIVDGSLKEKKVLEAREMVREWLRAEGLLISEEESKQNVSTAERTGGIVEPLPKLQWFIDVNKPIASRSGKTLKDLMRAPVVNREINILPDHFEKIYQHWINNLRDWCISRQIWFGHRVPVWYRGEEVFVGLEAPQGDGWTQDEDTLDTWFSSGLWTFSTLGWPDETPDLSFYHPTDVLETGHDILFFWVARMILMTEYALGVVPFRTVYLHGMVRDQQGRKMSKSLGNSIDPMEVAKDFGADAGRMALIIGNTPGMDSKIWPDKINAYKKFANKIWNITRFVLENTEGGGLPPLPPGEGGGEGPGTKLHFTPEDQQLRTQFDAIAADVTCDLDEFRLYMASEKLYHYLWTTFASDVLEASKPVFSTGTPEARRSRQQLLLTILADSLKLLHPFMPFLTEEIWQDMPAHLKTQEILMVEKWPAA